MSTQQGCLSTTVARVLGVGGLGTGVFFRFSEQHTLGRNESRQAELLAHKDACKLHIVAHYLSVLLRTRFPRLWVYPIGTVGDDTAGLQVMEEMIGAGIDVRFVRRHTDRPTLYSVCFLYPDGDGGNITSANSAAACLSSDDIVASMAMIEARGEGEIGLALPEISLDARIVFLRECRRRRAFTVASFATSEAARFLESGGAELSDLIVINSDEAGAVVRSAETAVERNLSQVASSTATRCAELLARRNPAIMVAVSDGSRGCLGWSRGVWCSARATPVEVTGTAGAGDALTAGILVGLILGMPFIEKPADSDDGSPRAAALDFGVLVAGASVCSPDAINRRVNPEHIHQLAREFGHDRLLAHTEMLLGEHPKEFVNG